MDDFKEKKIQEEPNAWDQADREAAQECGDRKETVKKNRGMKIFSYVLTALLSVAVTLAVLNFGVIRPLKEKLSADTSKLDLLEQVIDECYIGDADKSAMEDAAANAMVNAIGDRWSYYISAADYQAYVERSQNAYVGVGMTVAVREDGQGLDIRQVNAGGPAEEAGILPGDVLVGVNGTSVLDMDINDITDMVRGEENTTVDLTVSREGEELTFTATRRQFETVVATGEMLDGNIGLVTIENFNSRCCEESVAAIEALIDQGATALIFDVRNNPGGYKHELVNLLDYLLPEGDLFISEDYEGNREVDRSDKACVDLPMMVLVNSESYSAAEFFAAALREYGVAEIVGNQTCGKGYFQTAIKLNDGSAVNLSIGKYYTPNGVSLAEVGGITPDHVVEVDEELFLDIYADLVEPENDPQIQKAVEVLLAG